MACVAEKWRARGSAHYFSSVDTLSASAGAASASPSVAWASAAALAMVIYAMALPERYDIACGAYAFALIITLFATGQASSIGLLLSRGWETLIGGALGLLAALAFMPRREAAPHER